MNGPRAASRPLGDDLGLCQAAGAGDAAARRELVERLLDRVRAATHYLAAGHRDVDDFVQLSLIEILNAAGGFRGESSLETWASRITVRTVSRQLRRARFRAAVVELDNEATVAVAPRVEQELSSGRVARRVAELIGLLKPKQRRVVAMSLLHGQSLEEICAATGINPNTVKYQLRVGRAALRRKLGRDPLLAELIPGREP